METPFGAVDVFDAHLHFFSRRFFATLAKGLPEPPEGGRLEEDIRARLPFELDFPPEDPVRLADRWVEELDRHGVARSVLIASVPGDEESVAAAAGAHPARFAPYFMLDPTAPDALERARRGFRELGMKGLCLFPAMHHYHVWEERLRPILEQAAEAGGVVFVHCGQLKVGIRDKLGLRSPFDIRFANPLSLGGVARAFQPLPFVVPHFGCGFFRELLMVADESPNVFADTSSSNAWREKLPDPMSLESVFARALAVLGPERLLYGSDSSFFPRGWQREHFDAQVLVLEALRTSAGDARAILGGNLAKLLG